ncbi:MAG: FtsX-like permease family protein [Lentisphaerae bacterium]|nr:FtsX-like permease family protein [Lentisphaerota bacterium]
MLKLPARYALRNLRRRFRHSLMTVSGVAVIVFASVLMLSLNRGLERRVRASGEEANILLISRQGQNIMFSSITADELVQLSSLPDVALGAFGEPLVSAEVMHMATVECLDAESGAAARAPVYVRGITPIAYEVHRALRIVEGRIPEQEDEILAGGTAHVKLGVPAEALAPGRVVRFEDTDWTVSGRFEAGGSLAESEIWIGADTLKDLLRRRSDTFAVVRMSDAAAVAAAMPRFQQTGALERFFKGWPERDYYVEFGSALSWVLWMSLLMVLAIAAAGALIGANTMYTAVLNRMREIATYRVLGFTTGDVLMSFVIESVALALAGGVVGVAAGAALNRLPISLSYGAFFLVADAAVLGAGLGLSLLIGLAGGLFPALKGLRLTVIEGLRHG